MFRQKYFLVSSEKLLSGLLHFISLLPKSPVPSVLPRFYSTPNDFIRHHPYEMIFVDHSSLALSLLQLHSENLSIHDSLFYSTDPYILRHRSNSLSFNMFKISLVIAPSLLSIIGIVILLTSALMSPLFPSITPFMNRLFLLY